MRADLSIKDNSSSVDYSGRGDEPWGSTVFSGATATAKSGRRRRGRAFTLLVTLAVVCACGVLAVPAFGFVSRGTRSIVVPKHSTAVATPTCPAGEYVAFGGVMSQFVGPVSATNPNTRLVITTGVHRLGSNARAFTFSAVNPRSYGARYNAIAYCDRGPVPTVVAKTVRLGALSTALTTVSCPAGTVGVGGGFASGSGPKNVEYLGELVMNSPTQLAVGAANVTKIPTTLTALVYCTPGIAPTEHDTEVNVPGHKLVSAEVTCPPSTKLVWGGLDSSPPSGTTNNYSAVVPLSWYAPTATQWKVTAYNLGPKTGTLAAVAYCR